MGNNDNVGLGNYGGAHTAVEAPPAREIQPGDSIPHRIESGLDGSAVLVLCMSQNALTSDWATLQSRFPALRRGR